jgi:hypothetical protein
MWFQERILPNTKEKGSLPLYNFSRKVGEKLSLLFYEHTIILILKQKYILLKKKATDQYPS